MIPGVEWWLPSFSFFVCGQWQILRACHYTAAIWCSFPYSASLEYTHHQNTFFQCRWIAFQISAFTFVTSENLRIPQQVFWCSSFQTTALLHILSESSQSTAFVLLLSYPIVCIPVTICICLCRIGTVYTARPAGNAGHTADEAFAVSAAVGPHASVCFSPWARCEESSMPIHYAQELLLRLLCEPFPHHLDSGTEKSSILVIYQFV